ncbi:Proteasome subunit beta, bacterial [hydrothermal vent metagenome]|uniref:Proteasome subunit beta, bacterial n=1 Tax=hydrothermal vent metagenome TaxID=652676 RepID=A0A3B0S0X4_9ZZZZ
MSTDTPLGPLRIGEDVADASFLSILHERGLAPSWDAGTGTTAHFAEATTVLALTWSDGVLMAGDRRATAGNVIAHRRIRKVYPADEYSAVAISGTAGMAVELIKLFQTELEHYEKIEGARLSLEGKANYLARMVRGNLALAFQGLVVIPLFCGYDDTTGMGRLFSFDVVGGRYDELNYATTGSGGAEAKSFLKSTWKPDLSRDAALNLAVEALVAAAEEDAATGGPDIKRGIYPSVVVVSAEGIEEVQDDTLAAIAETVLEGRP